MLAEACDVIVYNGYLARRGKINGKIDFFHRNYFVIKNTEYLHNLIYHHGHVHHINFDKTDNRLCNLVMLTKEEHEEIHNIN